MTTLQEDGKTIELDEDTIVVSARVNGTVYGKEISIDEEAPMDTQMMAEKAVRDLIERIEGEV